MVMQVADTTQDFSKHFRLQDRAPPPPNASLWSFPLIFLLLFALPFILRFLLRFLLSSLSSSFSRQGLSQALQILTHWASLLSESKMSKIFFWSILKVLTEQRKVDGLNSQCWNFQNHFLLNTDQLNRFNGIGMHQMTNVAPYKLHTAHKTRHSTSKAIIEFYSNIHQLCPFNPLKLFFS